MKQILSKNGKERLWHFCQAIIPISFLLVFATPLHAQQLAGKKISLVKGKTTGQKIIAAIKEQVEEVRFTYDDSLNDRLLGETAITTTPLTVGEALTIVRNAFGIQYRIDGNRVVLSQPEKKPVVSPNAEASRGGTLKGRVVEFETSDPLPGASLRIEELGTGTVADNDGYYAITSLPAGKYTIRVSFVGYATEQVTVNVREDHEETYDVKLQGDNQLQEVEITGVAVSRTPVAHATERQLVSEIKDARMVVSGVSSEQISKSADRNAAQAIAKVAGVTIRDDKFIVIRGMNERYNLTYLNDNVAPSTELYSRAFALNLLPTRIIDKILVYKSPAPELLGDMTGGAVKIFTKDAKAVKHFDIEVQLGHRQNTTFNSRFLTYQGGKTDFLGFDDGARALPGSVPGYGDFTKARIAQGMYAKSFSDVLQYGRKTALPDMQLTANYYNAVRLFGRALSVLGSLSYKNENQRLEMERYQGKFTFTGNDAPSKLDRKNIEDQSTNNAQFSLLQNFTLTLRDSSMLQFKNFLLQQGQTATVLRHSQRNLTYQDNAWRPLDLDVGYAFNGLTEGKDIVLSYAQRFLYSGNFTGSHYYRHSKHAITWNAGFTYSSQSIPDQRVIKLNRNRDRFPIRDVEGLTGDAAMNWVAAVRNQGATEDMLDDYSMKWGIISRLWTKNNESVYNASLDYTVKSFSWLLVRAGTYQQWKQRVLFRRVYTVNEGDLNDAGMPGSNAIGGAGNFFDPNLVYFREQDLGKVWSGQYLRDDGSGLKVFDRTSGSDAYKASEQNNSGYAAVSLQPWRDIIDIYGGLRVEYNRQQLAGAVSPSRPGATNQPVLVDIPTTDWLPSVNVSVKPLPQIVARGAYGKTVNRPEFRELSPYAELDYQNNLMITGNTTLRPAKITNYDARLEWYFGGDQGGEMMSVGVFKKDITRPIERTIDKAYYLPSSSPATISFQNAAAADVKGIEIDVRKSFAFIPVKFFRELSFIGNYSHIISRVDSVPGNNRGAGSTERQLQGQSPYIVNVGLYYDRASSGTRVAVIVNEVGPRIYAASVGRSARFTPSTGSSPNIFDKGDQASLIELERRQVDIAVTQRIGNGMQLKLAVQNLLDDPIRIAEDSNFTYEYEPAIAQATRMFVAPQVEGLQQIDGDIISVEYKTGRYFSLSFSYSF